MAEILAADEHNLLLSHVFVSQRGKLVLIFRLKFMQAVLCVLHVQLYACNMQAHCISRKLSNTKTLLHAIHVCMSWVNCNADERRQYLQGNMKTRTRRRCWQNILKERKIRLGERK